MLSRNNVNDKRNNRGEDKVKKSKYRDEDQQVWGL